MTDPAPELTPDQRATLRDELLRLRAELSGLLADEAGLGGTVHLDQSAMGRVSRVDALQQQQMAQATLRRHKLRFERVEAALERHDDDPDTFGDCPECGESIGLRRLQAFPESVFCVPCLQARGG